MVAFHMTYGILLILFAIVVTVWEVSKSIGTPRLLRSIAIGLMDLQIVLGIIAWIIAKPPASFIAHPVLMVIAVLIAHIYTSTKRSRRTRVTSWVIVDILFILGAALFHS